MKKYVFGIDLGGTSVKLGLFTTAGELLDKWEIVTRIDNGGEQILPDIAVSLKSKLEEKGIAADEVAGVGLGVPGAVLEDRFVKPCVNLNGWGGDVADKLNKLCGFPVKVVNDANAAALGEMWQGGGKGFDNVVFVTLGTGVGGGIIVGGKLLTGVHGAGGEIGHINVNPEETDSCGCGNKGCVEQYCSATGVVRLAQQKLAATDAPSALRSFAPLTCKDVFDCAGTGDELAVAVLEQVYDYLGRFLATLCCVVDPEAVVLGGGVSRAGQPLLDGTKRYFDKYAFHACRETRFSLASLGNDAGAYGAFKLALNAFGE